jgi:hypothetical protein
MSNYGATEYALYYSEHSTGRLNFFLHDDGRLIDEDGGSRVDPKYNVGDTNLWFLIHIETELMPVKIKQHSNS